MSIATITFEDIDLANGKYSVNCNVTDTQTDDGLASAAHVTGMFIINAISNPMFSEGCAAYGKARGLSLRLIDPETVTMVLTDVNLEEGSFDCKLDKAEDAVIDGAASPALIAAMFIRDAMGSAEFRMACTEFAASLCDGHPTAQVREPTEQGVLPANNNTETQEVA